MFAFTNLKNATINTLIKQTQMKGKNILLGHGSGGRLSHDLIKDIFLKHFDNDLLRQQGDSALLETGKGHISFTTDSYVVDPIFFPGGDIGKLAVCGTVNDIAVSGAKPMYLSAGFIIEEGFSLNELESIVISMAKEAVKAGVKIVTGDTKVVNKGQCDKVFINTAGIGFLDSKHKSISSGNDIVPGDKIIINGSIGEHGMAIMAVRNFGNFKTDIVSDCAPLNKLIDSVLKTGAKVKFMRDATRGGIATVLSELAEHKNHGLLVNEDKVIVRENVRGMCELLGFDPFYIANEGKFIMVVAPEDANKVIETMKNNEFGTEASIIGEVTSEYAGKAILQTTIGGKRIIDMMSGEQLPRIC